jgi:hypothetical protein
MDRQPDGFEMHAFQPTGGGMKTQKSEKTDAISYFEDIEVEVDAWTLEELEDSADIGSLRSAMTGAHDHWE